MKLYRILQVLQFAKNSVVTFGISFLLSLLLPSFANALHTVQAGETQLIHSGEHIQIAGSISIIATGTLNASASGATITLTGDWENLGSFVSGDVIIDGTGTSNISGNTTFRTFTCQIGGKTLAFAAGSTQTFVSGLTLAGANGSSKLTLSSITPSSQYTLDLQSGHTEASYVHVTDSNLITNTILPISSTTGGNNSDYWLFSITISGQVLELSNPLAGVTINGGALGSTSTDSNGNYSFSNVTYNSSYTITPSKTGFTFTPTNATGTALLNATHNFVANDTVAPSAPVITSPTTGASSNDNTPTIIGTSEANATITLLRGGVSQGTTSANGSGAWSFTPGSSWSDATYSLTATATDAATNTSDASTAVTLTIDTATPSSPVITSPTTGASSSDNTPTISGTSEANAIITILRGGVSQGTTSANGSGAWSFTPGSAWGDATYSLTATVTDAANNTSSASTAVTLTIDTGTPSAPVITSPTTGASSNDNTPTIIGTSEANATITLLRGGVSQGTVSANGSGAWSFTPGSSWSDATYSLTATSSDAATNTSSASTAVTLTIDTATPSAPVITSPTTGASSNDNTPTISGTSEANSTITLLRGGVSQGTVSANGSGNWSFTPGSAWSDATYSLTATASDAATNTSSASTAVTLTIDTATPAAPAITSPTTGSVSNDNTPTIVGTSEASATITVYKNGVSLGTVSANGSGNWNYTAGSSWTDDTFSITATATDAATNVSSASTAVMLTIDTFSAAPVISSPPTGTTTADNTPTFSGTSEANAFVTIYRGGVSQGTVSANSSGNWSYTPGSGWSDALYAVKAVAVDLAGNTSSDSNTVMLNIDATAPESPVISSPATDTFTNDTTPTISGTCASNGTITVYANGVSLGTTTDGGTGTWSFTPSAMLEGVYTINATFTNVSLITSGYSDAISLGIDTSVSAPSITSPTNSSSTNDNTPTISGTAEAFSTVTVFRGGVSQGDVSANGVGAWSYTPGSTWADATYSLTASIVDRATNSSGLSSAISFTVDTGVPSEPVISSPSALEYTNDNTPTVSGTAEANSTITLYRDGISQGTAAVDGLGDWSFTPGSSWSDGTYVLRATAKDAANNTSNLSVAVTFYIDTATPSAPVITSPSDGAKLNDNTPTISGTAEANSTVTVLRGGVSQGTVSANGSGAWSYTPGGTWSDASYVVTVTATDAATNESSASTAVNITIDTVAPSAPSITTPTSGTNTNEALPTVSGTAEANSTVKLYVGGVLRGTVTANGGGAWSHVPTNPWGDGTHSLTATATDASGNTGDASSAVTVTIDTSSPGAPSFSSPANGSSTNDTTPTISGNVEADVTVSVYKDGVLNGSTTADNGGVWSYTPGSAWSEGSYVVTAKAADTSGNQSATSTELLLSIDLTPPLSGIISSPATGTKSNDNTPTISGAGEVNGVANILRNGIGVGTANINSSSHWTYTADSSWSDNTYSLTVTITDDAGNTGSASSAVTLTIDTAAPGAPVISSPGEGETIAVSKPTISGSGESGSTITIKRNGVDITSVQASGGAWSYTASSAWDDGAYALSATATDQAGNVSALSTVVNITLDVSVPAAPIILSPSSPSYSNDPTPAFSGTALADGVVSIYFDGTKRDDVYCSSSGTWTYTPSVALSSGTYSVTAKVLNPLTGGLSASSTALTLIVDLSAPITPTISSPAPNTYTTDSTPTIIGTAEAQSTVRVYQGVTELGQATANSSGAWSYTPGSAWTDGSYSISADSRDRAGNVSQASSVQTLNVDTSAPAAPVITGASGGVLTVNSVTPTISGTAEAYASLKLYVGNSLVTTRTVSNAGAWSYSFTTTLSNGATLKAKATDRAGNIGAETVVTVRQDDIDNDGLNGEEEVTNGTDPTNPDTDSDGVKDGQEVTDGTNPVDKGSNLQVLGSSVCSEWNGFLDMWNVMEHLNLSEKKLSLKSEIYSIAGNKAGTAEFSLSKGVEYDLLVHDMSGFADLSYGKVCTNATNGSDGDVDGRMVYYKPEYGSDGLVAGYQFAFAMPFGNGIAGTQFVPYNTYQPSLDAADAGNLVANWIQITNLESTKQKGELIFYDMLGAEIERTDVTLPGGARIDYSGHDTVGVSKVGIIEWKPNSAAAKFGLRNVRYLHRADGVSFDSAFQLEGVAGTGEVVSTPLDTTNGSSAILELANTLNESVSVRVEIYAAEGGNALLAKTYKLNAHQTYHLIADEILVGDKGVAVIWGSKANSVIATAMQYGRTSTLGIETLYGIQAKPAVGTVLRGTYNTFLGQGCRLLVTNPGESAKDVTISMKRYDGVVALADLGKQIPAHGLLDYDLCEQDDANVYGIVTVQTESAGSAFATVLRIGANEQYRFPTPVRE